MFILQLKKFCTFSCQISKDPLILFSQQVSSFYSPFFLSLPSYFKGTLLSLSWRHSYLIPNRGSCGIMFLIHTAWVLFFLDLYTATQQKVCTQLISEHKLSAYPSTHLFNHLPIWPTWNFQISFQPFCHRQICLLLFDMQHFSSTISDSYVWKIIH